MKTIIAISGVANQGKTHAVMAAAQRFPLGNVEYFNYDGSLRPAPEPNWVLCRGEVTVNGVTKYVGFSSEGDAGYHVQGALDTLAQGGKAVEVLVTACRTAGYSVENLYRGAATLGYEMVWTSLYHGEDSQGKATPVLSNGTDLNDVFAAHMSDLINLLLP